MNFDIILLFDFLLLQNAGGGFPIRVDGKGYESLFTLPGEKWKKRRPLISPAFSSHKIKLVI